MIVLNLVFTKKKPHTHTLLRFKYKKLHACLLCCSIYQRQKYRLFCPAFICLICSAQWKTKMPFLHHTPNGNYIASSIYFTKNLPVLVSYLNFLLIIIIFKEIIKNTNLLELLYDFSLSLLFIMATSSLNKTYFIVLNRLLLDVHGCKQ